ncbi:hypothetical protein CBOM_01133 [Ceraceosorus bombacis]|uniref:Uncharacterized protein n=1 Tax=Ceraceosorus bombacis TaxID=401625 RepID=A0A0P1BB34_9BASI|nr:hypothetical protein CBOM_01133 [Ceraceosorus bombacis]
MSPALPKGAKEHAAIEGEEYPPVRQLELAALLRNYNLLIDEAADLITKAATRSINSESPRDPPFAHKATRSRAPKDLGSLFKQDIPVCDRHKLLKTGVLHLCHTTLLPVSLQWAKGRPSQPDQRGRSPVPPVEACSLLAEASTRPNATAATIPQQQKAVSSVRLITSLFLDIATLCCWCGLASQPSSAAQFTTVGFGRAKAATAFLDSCLDHCQFYESPVSFIVVANSDPTSDTEKQGASEGISDTSAQLCRSLGLQVVNNDENNTVLKSDNIEVQAVLSGGGLETDRERLEELSTDAIELADAPKIIAAADMLNH